MANTSFPRPARRRGEGARAPYEGPVAAPGPLTLEPDDSMGISTVTEAPRWRHASAAVRGEPRQALRGSARLELISADSAELSFAGRQAPLAPLFLCPLLLALGVLPWLAPRPLDAARAATSLALVGAAGSLAAWSRPRRRGLRVASARAAAARPHDDVVVAEPGRVRWVLDALHFPGSLSATYAVALELDDGSSHVVLQNEDPERLLWQFSEVARHWPGPVECRWGLPAPARPWSIEPHSGPRARADDSGIAVVTVPLAHRPLIWCARLMAAFVVVDLSFLVTTAKATVAAVHPLSIILPVALASCLLALALGLGTGGWRLSIGGRVCRELMVLGLRRERGSVRLASVRGVHVLGAPSAERWHVLVDSADGPLAVPVPRANAKAIARALEQAIQLARK
jgi:hypothetical protein